MREGSQGVGRITVVLAFALAVLVAAPTSYAAQPNSGSTVLVRFKSSVGPSKASSVVTSRGATLGQKVTGGVSIVKLDPGTDAEVAAADLMKSDSVVWAEPNFTVKADGKPNDDLVTSGAVWGLANIGAFGTWERATGAGAVVAVLDSGVSQHPDLVNNLWGNPGETANGVDDDGDGYVDNINGVDFLNNDGNPDDEGGHGTHVSGTIAASANNSIGIAGVAPGAKVMALKFLDANGSGTIDGAVRAIDFAIAHGADVINASWSGPNQSKALKEAIDRAGAAGVIVVASAGNYGSDNDGTPAYPASFDSPNLLTVAALTETGDLANFSNWGATSVDLAAPGEGITSTTRDLGYEAWNGTSMAAPHVAGAAAVLASAAPSASVDQLTAAIRSGVKTAPALSGRVATGGSLNLASSFSVLTGEPVPTEPAVVTTDTAAPALFYLRSLKRVRRAKGGHKARVRFAWTRAADDSGVTAYNVLVDGRTQAVLRDPDGAGPRRAATSIVVPVRKGTHRWSVVATDPTGNKRVAAAHGGRVAKFAVRR